jgi:exopolysaccharide biosynthesis polyprenyl glycosylphosphotransferase
MEGADFSQQTSTTGFPLSPGLGHAPPAPLPARRSNFSGLLQGTLEGPGWNLVRPALDLAVLAAAVLVAMGGANAALHADSARWPVLTLPAVVVALFWIRGVYRPRLRALVLEGLAPVISGVCVAAMAVAVLGRLAVGEAPEETVWLRAWGYALIGVALARVLLSLTQRWARSRRLVGKPVLIVGAGMVGAHVARWLDGHPEYGLVPIGFVDEEPRSLAEVGGRDVPVLGTIDELDETVRRTRVKNVIVAFSSVADAQVSRLVQHCQEVGLEVSVVPRMFDAINHRAGYDSVGGLPLLSFYAVDPGGVRFAIKHALDRVLAFWLLVVLSPVIVAAAVAVKLSSPGPVMFTQRRVGRDGKIFDFYKFRSMRPPKEQTGDDGKPPSALELMLARDVAPGGVEGEDRRTRVGRLLRASSLDELPQLLNVLRGDMSLVGPRPERPEFVELFRQDIVRYGDRHRVKSGITGWAQVHGLRGATSLADRVELDNYYITHWSLGLDLRILVMTLLAPFQKAE